MNLDALGSRIREWLWPGSEAIALPMMDGPLKPNRRLDEARPCGTALPGCDGAADGGSGAVLVSAGTQIWRLSGEAFSARELVADAPSRIGAVATAGARIYAALESGPVLRIEQGRITARLEQVQGRPLRAVTALAVLPDGRVAMTEGSTRRALADWTRDLLEHGAEGRLLVAESDLSHVTVWAEGLAWPAGLHVQGDALWFSEAWRHRVHAVPLAGGATRPVLDHLPGYPGRMSGDPRDGTVWLCVFALRTQLLEFVLREHAYRRRMIDTIDPRYWIAPALSTEGHYLEPLQGGAIKKLGLVKPWAPPRSYGLVMRLNAQGEVIDSLHSRVGGLHHGITDAVVREDRLVVISRGGGRVLEVSL